MTLTPYQQTIARPVVVEGFGYWSGRDVRVEFRPAEPGTGIVFVRGDLSPPVRLPATVNARIEIPRRTSLQRGATTVEMIEHIMAALAGLQIDNCEVWVDQIEMPGCDGSSQAFVDALLSAGIQAQPEAAAVYQTVDSDTQVGTKDSWVKAMPATQEGLTLTYILDYGPNHPIGRQEIQCSLTPDTFCKELAKARTFILEDEAKWLLQQGLGTRVSRSDLLVFSQEGVVDNELRFADECVRHKALDLVGDLALSGCRWHADVIAYRSGHRLNAELVRALFSKGSAAAALQKTA